MEDSERAEVPPEPRPFGATPLDNAGRTLPAAVMLRFTMAENQVYPLAMTDPEGYERAITLVGLVANELRRSSRDFDEVLAARDGLIARLPELAREGGVEPIGLSPATIVDAASALRCRELQRVDNAE